VTGDNRRRNVATEVARGEESLAAARALLPLGLANDAMSRAYYGAYHHARALLLTVDVEPKTHGGLSRLLRRHFEEHIGEQAVSLFARLQTFRQAADYDAEARFESAEAEAELRRAEAFVQAARDVLESGGWLTNS
jgi:hypothetical protein